MVPGDSQGDGRNMRSGRKDVLSDPYTGLVAGLELLLPICRSEFLRRNLDPSPLRVLLDRHISLRSISDDFPERAAQIGLAEAGAACRLFLSLAQQPEAAPSISDVTHAVTEMVRSEAGALASQLQEPHGDWPSNLEQVSWLTTDLGLAGRSIDYVRTNASLVGRDLEERLFVIELDTAGRGPRLAVELDSASRLLHWFDRYDERERVGGGSLIREALSIGWEVLEGIDRQADASRLDVALQREFVQTDRYDPRDWIPWMASRTVDAVYAAVGFAFGKAPYPPAISDARRAATDAAAIERGMDPWDLGGVHRTLIDAPVLQELRAQLSASDEARRNALSLRNRSSAS